VKSGIMELKPYRGGNDSDASEYTVAKTCSG